MSILNVNKINPVGGGSTITIAGIASVTNNLSAIDITSTNISVGSSVTTNEFYGDQIKLGDNKKILLGEGNDIEIYHTGAVDMIEGKSLYLIQESQNIILRNLAGDEAYAKFFGNGAVELYHNGTKQVETSTNGLAFPSGKGIDFSASGNTGGMSSELLDDYEEGTFSPTMANSVTLHSGNDLLSYVKVGHLVHVTGVVRINSGNSGADFSITNMPFATVNASDQAGNAIGAVSLYENNMNSGYTQVICVMNPNAIILNVQNLRQSGNNAPSLDCNDNGYIGVSITYRAA